VVFQTLISANDCFLEFLDIGCDQCLVSVIFKTMTNVCILRFPRYWPEPTSLFSGFPAVGSNQRLEVERKKTLAPVNVCILGFDGRWT
jgi:hypothetical protein